ncbi:MAG: hypothetical protein PVH62_02315 [Anaerolineae bacterium]|jgi:hypothetical protein
MKYARFLSALAVLIFITVLSATVARGAAAIRAIAENRSTQEQQEPAQTSRAGTEARPYDLSWWTVDGGGGTFNTSGGYTLGGTSGQPDAATWLGGDYTLAGGFWGGVAVVHRVYLPLVLR